MLVLISVNGVALQLEGCSVEALVHGFCGHYNHEGDLLAGTRVSTGGRLGSDTSVNLRQR